MVYQLTGGKVQRPKPQVIVARTDGGPPPFPTQYFGLKCYYSGAVRDLCLVAEADGAVGMGGIPKITKGGVDYAIYLVETADPDASPVRMRTTTGIKAVRVKT
jgi:hypothetical protein